MSDRSGPKFENLRKVAQLFPAMAKQVMDEHLGTPVASKKPTKLCAVCCVAFDFQVTVNTGIEQGICDKCWEKLQYSQEVDGGKVMRCCAVVCGETFAFMVSSGLDDMAGKIVEVPEEQMIQISKQFKLQKRVKHRNDEKPAEAEGDNVPPVA